MAGSSLPCSRLPPRSPLDFYLAKLVGFRLARWETDSDRTLDDPLVGEETPWRRRNRFRPTAFANAPTGTRVPLGYLLQRDDETIVGWTTWRENALIAGSTVAGQSSGSNGQIVG